jgi:DNA-binding NarL/FixJ family response regulator
MITVLLADDYPLVRRNVRRILEMDPDLLVVGEASDRVETIHLLQQLQPDILVLDLEMPDWGAGQVIREAQQASAWTNLVILSMHLDEWYIFEAFKDGAKAYVFKTQITDDLVHAIHEVAAGHHFVSSLVPQCGINANTFPAETAMPNAFETMTTREQEVIHLIAEGCTNAQIAERLFISLRTVKSYQASIMRKLNLPTAANLVVYALRYNLSKRGSATEERG